MASLPDDGGATALPPHFFCNSSTELRAVRFCSCVFCVLGIGSSLHRMLRTTGSPPGARRWSPYELFTTVVEGTHYCTYMHAFFLSSFSPTPIPGSSVESADKRSITLRHVIHKVTSDRHFSERSARLPILHTTSLYYQAPRWRNLLQYPKCDGVHATTAVKQQQCLER